MPSGRTTPSICQVYLKSSESAFASGPTILKARRESSSVLISDLRFSLDFHSCYSPSFLSFRSRSVQLLNGLAAIDDHGTADDEASRLRTQPDDRIGDFFGPPHPSDWFLRDHPRPPFSGAAGEASHHRGVDIAGADDVNANVLCGVIEGRRPGEADHAVFRRGIRWAAFDSDDAGARGGVHDRAASLLEHERDLVLHAKEYAAEVDVDDPFPLVQVVVRSRSGLPRLNARVIEGEIQAPEGFDGLIQSRLHVLDPRHVAPDVDRLAPLFFDDVGRFLVLLFGNVGHSHTRSFASKRQRRSATDAASGPSYKCHFPCVSSIHLSRHKLFPCIGIFV